MNKKICGIYSITNSITRKKYIGSSKNVFKRFNQHLNKLKNGNHINIHLQRAYNIDGEKNFKCEILEECKIENLLSKEQLYLDSTNKKKLYNISKFAAGGDNISYHPNKDKFVKKQFEALKKWRESLTDAEKKIISENKKGEKNPNFNNGIAWTTAMRKKASREIKAKLKKFNEKRKGLTLEEFYGVEKALEMRKKYSKNAKKRIGDKNPFFGKHHTNELKKKRSKDRLGKYFGNQNIPFKINNVVYKSLGDASNKLGIHTTTIRHRLNSKNKKFENYNYDLQ